MYASVRRYRIDPKNMHELVKRIPRAIDVMSSLNGFRAYYVVRGGDDSIASLSLFSDEASAVLSNEVAAKWVKENADGWVNGSVDTVTGQVVAYA